MTHFLGQVKPEKPNYFCHHDTFITAQCLLPNPQHASGTLGLPVWYSDIQKNLKQTQRHFFLFDIFQWKAGNGEKKTAVKKFTALTGVDLKAPKCSN